MARNERLYPDYNLKTHHAQLIPPSERNFRIIGNGQSNIWYGKAEVDSTVVEYIERVEHRINEEIRETSNFNKPLEGFERETIIKERVNQSKFRTMMLDRFHSKCCLCGVELSNMLIASHIKPWSVCDNNEKVLEFNGLLLCPNHDRLFDKGYITFDGDGHIMISEQIKKSDRVFMNVNEQMKIDITNDTQPFMQYHRMNIFRGDT